MVNKQPFYGDGAINDPGNDGYGYEEHEQFVDSEVVESTPIIKSDSSQPLFGDAATNYQGNNGYGYEEHEQYVNTSNQEDSQLDDVELGDDANNLDARIMISAGAERAAVEQFADTWNMKYLGESFYDNGEALTDDNIADNTAIFYENNVPNKTNAFMNAMSKEFPDVDVSMTSLLGPDDNMNLDFDGLDIQTNEQGM